MRIFLDANILFSGARSGGAIRRLLEMLSAAGHELIADDYVLEEARRNLEVHGPAGAADIGQRLPAVQIFRLPAHARLSAEVDLVEKDRPVLASAVALGSNALITGDKAHFGHLFGTTVEGVAIHSPASFAEWLLSAE